MTETRQKTIAFSLVACVIVGAVTLLVCEGLVRLAAPQDLSGSWLVLAARGYEMNRAGATVRHQHGSRVVHYRFNDLHLRGGPIGEGRRVLVLGDSFTFGWLLEEEETYVHLLEAYADRELGEGAYTFLNGGVEGWGIANQVAFLEEWGPQIRPEMVLVFLGVDDVERSARSGLYAFASPGGAELEARERRGSRARRLLDGLPGYPRLLEHSHLVQLAHRVALSDASASAGAARRTAPDAGAAGRSGAPEAARLGQALFRRMKGWCEAHGAELLVLTTGFHHWYADRLSPGDAAFYAQAEDFFRSEGVPFGDLAADLAAAGPFPESFTLVGGRPNADGGRLIADAAWRWLRTRLPSGARTPVVQAPVGERRESVARATSHRAPWRPSGTTAERESRR